MKRLSRLRTYYLLIFQCLLVAAAFLCMIIIGGYFGSNIVTKYLKSYGEGVINASAETLQTYFDGHEAKFEDMTFIVEDLHRQGYTPAEIEKELEKWADRLNNDDERYQGVLFIYGLVDEELIHSSPWEEPPGFNAKDRPWYIGALENYGEIYYSPPYVDAHTGEWVLSMSRVLNDPDGSAFGVLSFDIYLSTLTSYIQTMGLLNDGFGALLDSDMRFVAHPDESFFGKKMEDIPHEADEYKILAAMLRDNDELNAYRYNSFDGVDRVLFSRKLYNNWYIFVNTPLEIYNRDVNTMMAVLSVTGIVATLILCTFMTIMYRARLRSDEANRFKSSFLANMSHEIRTPMNAIIGMTELLLHSDLPKRDREYVRDISKSANSLLSIINDILDLAKVESGKLSLSPVHYDFPALVDNVASMFTYVAHDKGLEFKFECEGDMPSYLYGDDIKLRQTLTNICGNAIKFTTNGYVRFRVLTSRQNNSIVFEISDTGMGVRKEDIPTLFDAFAQSKTEQNRNIVGTGLGLAISKIFIEMMGGSISLASEYGQGSTFTVKIPLVEGDPTKAAKESDRLIAQSFKAPQVRVLIVDDNEYNLKVAQGMLALFLIDAHTAQSGHEAIEAVKNNDYDIVFMDHMMPEMDGIETTAEIRKLGEKQQQLVIIALTANAIKGAKEMFLERGFNGFISKPIEIPILARALMDWLPSEKILEIPLDERKTAPDSNEQDEEDRYLLALREVTDINAEIGLSRVNGLKKMYRNNLQLFSEKLGGDAEKMKAFLDTGDINGFAIIVHAMKSTLASIGAPNLSEIARGLEAAAKNNDDAYCIEHYPAFYQQLLTMHEQLQNVFPPATATERPPGDAAFLQKKVQIAIAAIDDFDTDAGLAAVDALTAYDFGAGVNTALDNAASALKRYEYDEAREALEACL
jgi:signal transduction histidine kinase/DNA-binding NarL/FixJ family response regulator